MKLILHIGMQKTGTSALQYFLHENRNRLLKDGYRYPSLLEFCDVRFPGVSYHNCIAASLSNMSSAFPRLTMNDIRSLRALIDNSDQPIILSAEDFSRILKIENVRSFTTKLDVKIIVYLRSQADWAQSMYNQRNKILFGRADDRIFNSEILSPRDLFQFLQQERYAPLLKYDNLLERWSEVSENLDVRLFSKDEFVGGNLISDFMDAIDIDDLNGYRMPPRVNDNLANRWIEIARETADSDGVDVAKNFMRRLTLAAQEGILDLSGPTKILPQQIIDKIRADYSDHNQRVARKYFKRNDLFV